MNVSQDSTMSHSTAELDALVAEFERARKYVEEFAATDEGYADAVSDAAHALAALRERTPELATRLEQLERALTEIAKHESGVSDNLSECGECRDVYLGPYCDVKRIARALTQSGNE